MRHIRLPSRSPCYCNKCHLFVDFREADAREAEAERGPSRQFSSRCHDEADIVGTDPTRIAAWIEDGVVKNDT